MLQNFNVNQGPLVQEIVQEIVQPPVLHGVATSQALCQAGLFAHEAKQRRLANVAGVTEEQVGAAMLIENTVITSEVCFHYYLSFS